MGATVSVCNASFLILNIAFSQIGPVYYQNSVKPGECMVRKVGKLPFRVEARPDIEINRYRNIDVAIPIIKTVAAVSVFGITLYYGYQIIKGFIAKGSIMAMIPQLQGAIPRISELVNRGIAFIHGARPQISEGGSVIMSEFKFMNRARYFSIINGPTIDYNFTLPNGTNIISIDTDQPDFELVEDEVHFSDSEDLDVSETDEVIHVFNSINKNGEKGLTLDDVTAWVENQREKGGAQIAESNVETERIFKLMDKNGDGFLSLKEVLAYFA
ncbi:hypothetical protein B4U79_17330 [Dinothrombium tinctorium]|uniref:EF-hand domain-containing protein n=1 Tax=Dinothrombium tinctorium TaxID=1965070 RepID=A0A443RF51_9ACAR|nr:hypothetical protein B4U79_17330 [Dinothrombium tinctorium]